MASEMRSSSCVMSVTGVQLPTPAVERAAMSSRLPVPPSNEQLGPMPRAKVKIVVPAGMEPARVLTSGPIMAEPSSASERKSSQFRLLTLAASSRIEMAELSPAAKFVLPAALRAPTASSRSGVELPLPS